MITGVPFRWALSPKQNGMADCMYLLVQSNQKKYDLIFGNCELVQKDWFKR